MRIGVLGYGSIGKRHCENLRNLGHSDLLAYDPNGNTPNVREFVIDQCDAIIVASPSQCHAKDLMDVLEADKHVLVEKPFGYDCPLLLDGFLQGTRSRNPKLIIATGFNLRFHHSVTAVKTALLSGVIGRPITASFTVNQKTTRHPYLMDGIIRNWMSHEIDLAHYLLGNGKVTHCQAALDEHDRDTIDCLMTMELEGCDGLVYLQGDYYSEPEQRYFWIEGEKGNIYCNLVNRQVMIRMKGESPKPFHFAGDNWDLNYISEVEAFLESIKHGQHQPYLATGEDGVRALYSVMEAREKAGLK